MNIMNIFSYANSINALLWASALACAVAMVMLLIQRILSLSEYMEVSANFNIELLNSPMHALSYNYSPGLQGLIQ